MTRILLTILTLGLSFQQVSAQIYYEDKEKSVTVISYGDKEKSKNSRSKGDLYAIKIGLFDFAYGHQSIYFERVLNKFFSVEASAGIAHRNFIEDVSSMLRERNRLITDEFAYANTYDLNVYPRTRKAGIGYAVGFTPRIYKNGWGMEGFYFGPSIKYQTNNYKYIKDGLNEKESQKKLSVGVALGGVSNNSPLCIDYGIVFGYKQLTERRYFTDVQGFDGNALPEGLYNFKTRGANFELYLNIGGFFGAQKKKTESSRLEKSMPWL